MIQARWAAAVACLLAGAARAQTPDVGSAPPAPPLEPRMQAALDAERLAGILATTAADTERSRMAGGIAMLTLGAAAIPVGVVAQSSWNQEVGIALWFNGIVFVATGLTTVLVPNDLELLARTLLAQRQVPELWLPRAERVLAEAAAKAERGRTWNGTFNVALGVVSVGLGAVGMAIGSSSTDRGWGAAGVVFGATLVGTGIGELFFPSAAERALALWREGGAPGPPVQLTLGAAPLPGGAAVAVGGRF